MKLLKTSSLLILLGFIFPTLSQAQTVLIPGNSYAFQWTSDPDIGLYFSSANSRYEFRDLSGGAEWWCNPIAGRTYFRGDLVVGATNNTISRMEVSDPGSWSSAVSGSGSFGPTTGYLGVQGTANFDGVASLDIAGDEVGVLGVSTGSSLLDNYGVLGHSNGIGVYASHSANGYTASLASPTYAAYFNGPSRIDGGLDVEPGSGGYIVLGSESGLNIAIDNNEIMARNNGTTSQLNLNNNGGNISMGNINSIQTKRGQFRHILNGFNSASPGPFYVQNGTLKTSWDGNEVQTYSSDVAGGTYYLNFWGGNVNLANGLLYADGAADEIGINTSVPDAQLDVQGKATSTQDIITSEVNYSGTSDVIAVNGTSEPNGTNSGWGIGLQGEGGYRGVVGIADGNSYTGTIAGVLGNATGGTGAGVRYGVWGLASGGSTNYGVFASGDMAYTGSILDVSDARFKQNVEDIENASDLISQLKPHKYDLKVEEYDYMQFQQGEEYGFIAQELEQVLPLLVSDMVHPGREDENGRTDNPIEFKGVNYTGMIPIIVAAMQEQQDEIAARDEAIEELIEKAEAKNVALEQMQDQLDRLAKMVTQLSEDLSSCCVAEIRTETQQTDAPALFQNVPNPFTQETTIRFFLPYESQNASLLILDLTGRTIKNFDLQEKGYGHVSFSQTALASGQYIYALVIDGKKVASRQMTIVE